MKRKSKAYKGCWWSLIGFIAMLIVWLLSSCKSVEYIQVPVVHTDTVYQSKLVHDSIYQHDSITIRERGDSVWIERWHTRYVERERTDTVYKSIRDSIPYPVEKRVEVPRDYSWSEKTLMKLGWLMLAAIGAAIMYLIFKIKTKL